jgi:succinate-acetate transporter protein
MISPLGRYSDVTAAFAAVILVMAAVLAHLAIVHVSDYAWLDTVAGLAIGVVLGQRASTNGAARLASAANTRLDSIGAPAAAALPKDPTPAGQVL